LCENRAEDAREEDVEQVEKGSDSGDDRRVPVSTSRRQAVEARRDGNLRSAKAFALRLYLPVQPLPPFLPCLVDPESKQHVPGTPEEAAIAGIDVQHSAGDNRARAIDRAALGPDAVHRHEVAIGVELPEDRPVFG
jgi:hypothetical protein